MRRIFVLISFFIFTPILIFVSLLYFLFLTYHQNQNYTYHRNTIPRVAFAALPTSENVLGTSVISKDARIELVKQFFEKYNSPLTPFAQKVVDEADKYNIDFRLIPSIAMQESNLCKKIIANSFNCWGYGIYGKKVTKFASYSEGIEAVSKTLAKYNQQFGLETPEEIMTKYTPSNTNNWAQSVSYFMSRLQ